MLFDLSLLFVPLVSFASGFFLFMSSSSSFNKAQVKVCPLVQTESEGSVDLTISRPPDFNRGDGPNRNAENFPIPHLLSLLTNVAEPPRECFLSFTHTNPVSLLVMAKEFGSRAPPGQDSLKGLMLRAEG